MKTRSGLIFIFLALIVFCWATPVSARKDHYDPKDFSERDECGCYTCLKKNCVQAGGAIMKRDERYCPGISLNAGCPNYAPPQKPPTSFEKAYDDRFDSHIIIICFALFCLFLAISILELIKTSLRVKEEQLQPTENKEVTQQPVEDKEQFQEQKSKYSESTIKMESENNKYHWMQARLWLGLILYWLISMIGAGVIAGQGASSSAESGWVTAIMLIFISICMITERGQWKIWQRMLFVPLALIVQAILSALAVIISVVLLYRSGRWELIDRSVAFIGSIPIVVYAMRRSKLFVERIGNESSFQSKEIEKQPQELKSKDETPQEQNKKILDGYYDEDEKIIQQSLAEYRQRFEKESLPKIQDDEGEEIRQAHEKFRLELERIKKKSLLRDKKKEIEDELRKMEEDETSQEQKKIDEDEEIIQKALAEYRQRFEKERLLKEKEENEKLRKMEKDEDEFRH